MTHLQFTRRTAIQAAGALSASLAIGQSSYAQQPQRDVLWLPEIQIPPAKLPTDTPKLDGLLVDDRGQPIANLNDWKSRRDEIRRWWLDFLGPLPAERKAVPKLAVLEEDRPDGVIRQLVRYEVEPGITTEAYLLKPEKQSGKTPGIAVFHSTVNYTIRQPAGLEGPAEKHFGLRYAKKGCVCFCPRNFLWPKISAERLDANAEVKKLADRAPLSNRIQPKGMAKMLYDALIAVDILASLPEVDASRIGSIGHSLGAKETLYLAAFDERVKATASSEGGIGTKFSNWEAPWYLGPAIKEPTFTHEHHELLALAAPRPFLLVGGNSADGDRGWPFIAAALPVYELYGKPARLGQFNHGKGHAVPPESEQRIEEWLLTYL
ncbi:MAG TPA: dienelactone hydrolase family protein [Pirellulaceae bacterium]|nr:dienelactone hydrolase family protein [Pirellulaceae bacterium]